MLDGYVSEKEQIEAIQKWWRENGKFLMVAIIIGLAIGFGWRYWHKVEMHRAEKASVIYQSLLQADTQNKTSTVEGGAKLLMNDFSSTPYASLAALLSAKEAVTQNQLPVALTQLQWVISNGKQKRLKQIARINAARILLAQKNPTAAMNMLKVVDDKSFAPLIAWVKGDIATQQGDSKAADKYYTDAKKGLDGFAPAEKLLSQRLAQPTTK